MRPNDLGFQRIQNMIIRSASAVMYTIDIRIQCKNRKTDIPFGSLIEQLIDVTGLLSHECHDLSQKRREAIKPPLKKKLQKLVYNVPKDSKELFGDNVEKRIKAIFFASNALTSHRTTGRLRSFGNNDRSKTFQGYQKGSTRRQRSTFKAQAGRQLSGNLESKRFSVEVSQNQHIDFMILKSAVITYQTGQIKKLLQSLVRNYFRL